MHETLRRLILLSAGLLLGQAAVAIAQDDAGKQYFCVEEVAGGIRYDEDAKQWRGVSFKTSDKFVLSTKQRHEQAIANKDRPHYDVLITKSGSSTPVRCLNYSDPSLAAIVTFGSRISCSAYLTEYIFDLSTNRFLSSYMVGYLDLAEDNVNTPNISGGTCTPIN